MTGYSTSFCLQPVNIRQQILLGWSRSYFPQLRQLVKSLAAVTIATWVKQSSAINPVLGFPRAPVHGKPGKGFDYSFLEIPPGEDQEVVETDVVIVGSGCGGGVCAKNLAEAGHRVLVTDRAYHFPAKHLPMSSTDAGIHLFHNGGVDTSDDNSVAFVAGQAWGGGGTINWSASLQTQGFVRQEWADEGLSFFTSSEYQDCLDRVCQRMGVSTKYIEHNENNRVILEGGRKLGFSVKEVPQNTGGNKHYCGYCTHGCGAAEKQGPVVSWLPDAANAGAQFMEGFEAEKIVFDFASGRRITAGVEGTWTSRDEMGGVSGPNKTKRKVMIKAKRVIVSCGTLHSPLLLLRSDLTNPQIGRNLHCHPGKCLSHCQTVLSPLPCILIHSASNRCCWSLSPRDQTLGRWYPHRDLRRVLQPRHAWPRGQGQRPDHDSLVGAPLHALEWWPRLESVRFEITAHVRSRCCGA